MTTTMTMTDAEIVDVIRKNVEAEIGTLFAGETASLTGTFKHVRFRANRNKVFTCFCLKQIEKSIANQIGIQPNVVVSTGEYYNELLNRHDVCFEFSVYL